MQINLNKFLPRARLLGVGRLVRKEVEGCCGKFSVESCSVTAQSHVNILEKLKDIWDI